MHELWMGGSLPPVLGSDLAPRELAYPVNEHGGRKTIRRGCVLVAEADPSLVELTLTIRLPREEGSAASLLRSAQDVTSEFGLRTRLEVHRAGRTATVHLWTERRAPT